MIRFLVFLVKMLYCCFILPIPDSFPLVQALLCLTRSSITAFQLVSLLLLSLFCLLSAKCFKESYLLPPEYAHFFAFLTNVLRTPNSKCCWPSPSFTSYFSVAAVGFVHVVSFPVFNTGSDPQWVCNKKWVVEGIPRKEHRLVQSSLNIDQPVVERASL